MAISVGVIVTGWQKPSELIHHENELAWQFSWKNKIDEAVTSAAPPW